MGKMCHGDIRIIPSSAQTSKISLLSRNLYPAASDKCPGRMSGSCARSAMVRASLMIRVHARADRPILSIMRSSNALHSLLNGQYFSICLLFMAELQNIFSPANLAFCMSRAFLTLSATVLLDSEGLLSTSLRVSIGFIHNCMSIQLSD